MKLPLIPLWKAVVLEVGCRGCKRTPKSLDLLKMWAKALKIWVKMVPNVVSFKKWGPMFAWKHVRPYFRGYTKKKSSWSLWEKIYRQKWHKNFSGKFGKIRAKFCTPDICLLLYLWRKSPPALLPIVWKGRGGKALAMPHSPVCLCILFYMHSLLVVVVYNVSLQWT